MTQAMLETLLHPWRKFPQILVFYASVWLVGAATLTFVDIAFHEKAIPPQAPSIETNPVKENRSKPSPEVIANAWNAARASNDINTLYIFIARFPDSQYAAEARKRIGELEKIQKMQVADAGDSISIVAQLLENKDRDPAPLDKFVISKGFEREYPLGFAIFYFDGHKTLSYGNTTADIKFDPTTIEVVRIAINELCISGFVLVAHGTTIYIDGTCFGTSEGNVLKLMKVGDVSVEVQALGQSTAGAAWIIGLK